MAKTTLFVFCLGLTLSSRAFAWPPTFGAEFTFTNGKLWAASIGKKNVVRTVENEAARNAMTDVLLELCKRRGDCSISFSNDKYNHKVARVIYNDGWWFQMSLDPSVVEIQTKPSTLKELTAIKDRIQNDIFESAKKVDLQPDLHAGGGHIHIGHKSALDDDARLFRNFVVDYANHPELALGVLEDDLMNAPPIAALTAEQQEAFAEVIERFDQGKIKSIRRLAKEINENVFFTNPHSAIAPPAKYQAMNLSRISYWFPSADETIEIRALRAQTSADEYLRTVRLFQSRLKHLKSNHGMIPYLPPEDLKQIQHPQMLVDGYYTYVTESGLKWDEYKTLMPEYLQKVPVSADIQRRMHFIPFLRKAGPVRCFSGWVYNLFSGR